jgi:phage/plasmid-associated DNA primase
LNTWINYNAEARYNAYILDLKSSRTNEFGGFVVVDNDIKDPAERQKMTDHILQKFPGGIVTISMTGKHHIWYKRKLEDATTKTKQRYITTEHGDVDLLYDNCYEPITHDEKIMNIETMSEFSDFVKDGDIDRTIIVSDGVKKALTNEQIEIMDIIKVEYLEEYGSWISISQALLSITNGNFDVVDYYSQKASNYDSYEAIVKKFDTFKRNDFSEGTIRHYAKISNKDKYHQVVAKYTDFTDLEHVSEHDLAMKVLQEVGNIVIYDKHEKNLYILNKQTNIWVGCDPEKKGAEVRKLIQDTLLPIIETKLLKWKGKKDKDLNDDEKAMKKKYCAARNKLTHHTSLNSIRLCFLDEVMSHSKDYKLDLVRRDLFCFSCGKAYNTDTLQLVDIQPQDYVSRTSGSPHIELSDVEYDILDEKFQKLLDQIFADDPEKCLSVLTQLRQSLTGYKVQLCNFWSGTGGNGKGTVMDIHKHALGNEYLKDVGHTLITAVAKSSLDSLSASINKMRCVIMSEPPEHLAIACSKVKQLTGENELSGRDLHQKAKDSKIYNCSSSFFCQYNRVPKFDEEPTNAMYRRFRDTNFTSEFTLEPDKVDIENHIYPADDYWQSEKVHETFRMYYIKRLILHTPKELFYPESVMEHSRSVLDGNDHFWTWCEDNMDFTSTNTPKNEAPFITYKEFSQRFREDNGRLGLSSGQVKDKIKLCKSLKPFLSDRNPKTRSRVPVILFCRWKPKTKDYSMDGLI